MADKEPETEKDEPKVEAPTVNDEAHQEPEPEREELKEDAQISAQSVTLPTFPFSGVKTTFGVATGSTAPSSSTGYTPVAWIEDDLAFEGFENAVIEVKPLNSTVVFKIAGRRDCGTITGTASLVTGDATFVNMQTLFFAKTMFWGQIQLPDGSSATSGSTYTYQGFLSKFTPGPFTGEEKVMYNFEVAVNGDVTYTQGS